jgi:DNA-binding LacI/PurR family transcriptional regulator
MTALFCNVDFYAAHIISALHTIGYRVPDDISVVGFDDLDIAQMIHPQLTTVQVNRSIMAGAVDASWRIRQRRALFIHVEND